MTYIILLYYYTSFPFQEKVLLLYPPVRRWKHIQFYHIIRTYIYIYIYMITYQIYINYDKKHIEVK